jgi:hypothetical protein
MGSGVTTMAKRKLKFIDSFSYNLEQIGSQFKARLLGTVPFEITYNELLNLFGVEHSIKQLMIAHSNAFVPYPHSLTLSLPMSYGKLNIRMSSKFPIPKDLHWQKGPMLEKLIEWVNKVVEIHREFLLLKKVLRVFSDKSLSNEQILFHFPAFRLLATECPKLWQAVQEVHINNKIRPVSLDSDTRTAIPIVSRMLAQVSMIDSEEPRITCIPLETLDTYVPITIELNRQHSALDLSTITVDDFFDLKFGNINIE